MIVCRVLGPVDIEVHGGPAPPELLWRKHLALLVYLARSPRRARTREHLCALLWPDKAEGAARHSLNEALRVLRGAAGDALETTAGQIRLAPDAARLDVDDLDREIERGSWGGAAALVAGEFLEGFSVAGCTGIEDWLHQERRHWNGRSIGALLAWSAALLRSGRAAEAIGAAARAERLDPASDAAACAIMAALAAQGDVTGALAHGERFGAAVELLGSAPAAETLRLAERIRTGTLTRARAASQPAAPVADRRAPLTGRATELEQMLQWWDECRTGAAATAVVLDGDSGTGKSRLLQEFLGRTVLAGATVALLRAVESDLADDGRAMLGLARGGLLEAPGLPAAAPEALAALAARLPEWADRFRSPPPAEPMPVPRAMALILEAVLGEGPLVIAIDDAHHADRGSLLGLLGVLRDLSRTPLFIVLAALPHPPREELDELRRRLGGEIRGGTIRLEPLNGEAIRELAAWSLPTYDSMALERVARRVASDSAGLPFLVVELLSALAHGLDLRQGAAAWPSPLHTLTQSMPGDLPDTVVAALRIGFRRLAPPAREVLCAAAVLGDRCTDTSLARATGMPADQVQVALDELEWQRWLEADGLGYGFVASIARRVIERDMLTPGQHARLRQRAGLTPA